MGVFVAVSGGHVAVDGVKQRWAWGQWGSGWSA